MPLKLADLAKQTKRIALDFEGEAVALEVRVHRVTPNAIAAIAALEDMSGDVERKLAGMSEQVAALVATWDVLGADGKPFPLVAERLAAEIPAVLLGQVLMAAVGAVRGAGETPAPAALPSGATSGAIS